MVEARGLAAHGTPDVAPIRPRILTMDYETTLENAKARLQELAKQRDTIDREMQGLMRIIEGAQISVSPREPVDLPPIVADSDAEGFTKTVRLILARSMTPLAPTEVRDALEMMGVEASSPKVLLIQVHNTLRRLFEQGEIEQVPRDGKMAYRMLTVGDVIVRTLREHPVISMFSAIPSAKPRTELKELNSPFRPTPTTKKE